MENYFQRSSVNVQNAKVSTKTINVSEDSVSNKIAKSKLNQNIGKALTDTQVQYSIGKSDLKNTGNL